MPQPARDAKEDSADYWFTQANKAVPGCDAKKTEAQLLETNLEKVREDAKKLEGAYEERGRVGRKGWRRNGSGGGGGGGGGGRRGQGTRGNGLS